MFDSITLSNLLNNLAMIAPEMVVIVAIAGLILAGLIVFGRKGNRWMGGLSLLASAVALYAAAEQFWMVATPMHPFGGILVVDRLAGFFKVFALLGTVLVILATLAYKAFEPYRTAEYYAILFSATLGILLLAMSSNWLMFYLAMETLSLGSYVLTGYLKRTPESTEASMKYFIYGAAASAVMLFGISYLYGLTGTLEMSAIFTASRSPVALLVALLMVYVGLGFKISAVPFHFWAPDVYQGAPTPITAYLAVVSKAAGFIAVLRVFSPGIQELAAAASTLLPDIAWEAAFWAASVVTMTLGNLVALRQRSLKRMLAYSSIAHAGYILMGLAVLNKLAIHAILFYLVAYLIMNLGAFVVVIYLENRTGTDRIDAYPGLIQRAPLLVVVMAILLFSLTGLPPTVGFIGKLMIFGAVIQAGLSNPDVAYFYYGLALIGAINTAISLYYYMYVLKVMVLSREEEPVAQRDLLKAASEGRRLSWQPTLSEALFLLAFAIPTLWFGLAWGPLQQVISLVLT